MLRYHWGHNESWYPSSNACFESVLMGSLGPKIEFIATCVFRIIPGLFVKLILHLLKRISGLINSSLHLLFAVLSKCLL